MTRARVLTVARIVLFALVLIAVVYTIASNWSTVRHDLGRVPPSALALSTALALLGLVFPLLGWRALLADLRFQLLTGGVLVMLAPLVVVADAFSLALVPVLILPVAAVRISAQLATQREYDALHDGLTSLPNRALLQRELDRLLREAEAPGGS